MHKNFLKTKQKTLLYIFSRFCKHVINRLRYFMKINHKIICLRFSTLWRRTAEAKQRKQHGSSGFNHSIEIKTLRKWCEGLDLIPGHFQSFSCSLKKNLYRIYIAACDAFVIHIMNLIHSLIPSSLQFFAFYKNHPVTRTGSFGRPYVWLYIINSLTDVKNITCFLLLG